MELGSSTLADLRMAVIVPTTVLYLTTFDIGVVPYTLVVGPRCGQNKLVLRASVTSFQLGFTMKLDKDAGQVLVATSVLQDWQSLMQVFRLRVQL